MVILRGWCSSSRALLALLLFVTTAARAGPLPLWELEGGKNHVMLMGSVHFLRPADYPLRPGLQAAFDEADVLLMEIDMSAVDPVAAQASIARLSIDANGRGLRDLMGDKGYQQANAKAADLGIPLMLFDQFEPWFAALSVTQVRMQQIGFDPAWGVETMLTRKAATEGKPIRGLETIEEQLGFMDQLDLETQQEFLLQSLDEAAKVQDEVETIVRAWREGDTRALESSLLKGLSDAPELYDAILVQRNRNWVAPISELLDQPEDYLVIVGAMHLVGEDSVIAMLEKRGIRARQLSDADFTAASAAGD